MFRTLVSTKYRDMLLGAALLCAAAALLVYPQDSLQSARDGLSLCANVIIPSLFPFFVLSSLAVELGMAQQLGRLLEGVMRPLFRVDGVGACALVLGFVGGYPVGARTAISLYRSGQLSRVQTQRLLAFCNNSGPAFILGVVGAGVFSSSRVGLLLYLVHMAASLCVGVLFRFYGGKEASCQHPASSTTVRTVRFSGAFTTAVTQALSSILSICAFVVLFAVVLRLLTLSGALTLPARLLALLLHPIGVDERQARLLLSGLLEVTSGVTSLSSGAPAHVSMASFMLGWAGLSVHCQVLSFLTDSDLSSGTYLAGKAVHGVLCALFTGLLTHLFPLPQPVSGYLVQEVSGLSGLEFTHVFLLCVVCAWLLFLLFFTLTVHVDRRKKKSGGKAGRNQV